MKKYLHCAATAALIFALAACGGGPDTERSPEPPPSESAAPEGVDPNKTSPQDLPTIPAMKKGWQGAVKDVKFGECPTTNGEVTVDAKLTNPTDEPQDYAVVVSWVNSSSDVMGRAVQSVKGLKPGETKDLVLSAKLKAPATVSCTFHVSRGDFVK